MMRTQPMMYKSVLRPLLFRGDAEKTHEQTLAMLSRMAFLERALENLYVVEDPRLETRVGALSLKNPVGLAAGFDKNGVAIRTWPGFGFGFIEIGAVTAQAQPGQPKPRLFRLPDDQALINRLGFNNEGAEAIAAKLKALRAERPLKIPLGINIGRTKIVATKDAAADYLFTFTALFPYGDYFTLNVSSPNTPELRDLQQRGHLAHLVATIQAKNRELASAARAPEKPVFVKIDPDMDFAQADEVVAVARAEKLSGIVATNASAVLRENLTKPVDQPGGLSGKPLKARATDFIRHLYRATGGALPIIGAGGIFTAEDAYEKIRAGAGAVQILTGFVYEGPGAVKRINRGLLKLIERDGFKNVAAAVGTSP
ncbi:MAG TPA: quinone-dependent dihydroorotate dehydrogenase [Verrucomicrobiae bacterium]|jgi:dihydroorotate dehydrogenase|nr:quinone-dependent dihydroorotate dehydrogenase [Verrucomicrobiae bacterium]